MKKKRKKKASTTYVEANRGDLPRRWYWPDRGPREMLQLNSAQREAGLPEANEI